MAQQSPTPLPYATPQPAKSRWPMALIVGAVGVGVGLMLVLLMRVSVSTSTISGSSGKLPANVAPVPTGTYQGQPLGHWLPLLEDADDKTQAEAAKAVGLIYDGAEPAQKHAGMMELIDRTRGITARLALACKLARTAYPDEIPTLAPIVLGAFPNFTHSERLESAIALQAIGSHAKTFAPQIRKAWADEPDDLIKDIIKSALDDASK